MDTINIELLTVKELARLLRVHQSTIRRWVQDGVIDAVKLPQRGGKQPRQRYRFYASQVESLIQLSEQVQA